MVRQRRVGENVPANRNGGDAGSLRPRILQGLFGRLVRGFKKGGAEVVPVALPHQRGHRNPSVKLVQQAPPLPPRPRCVMDMEQQAININRIEHDQHQESLSFLQLYGDDEGVHHRQTVFSHINKIEHDQHQESLSFLKLYGDDEGVHHRQTVFSNVA